MRRVVGLVRGDAHKKSSTAMAWVRRASAACRCSLVVLKAEDSTSEYGDSRRINSRRIKDYKDLGLEFDTGAQ